MKPTPEVVSGLTSPKFLHFVDLIRRRWLVDEDSMIVGMIDDRQDMVSPKKDWVWSKGGPKIVLKRTVCF